jgi:hypothetical protein
MMPLAMLAGEMVSRGRKRNGTSGATPQAEAARLDAAIAANLRELGYGG